MSASSDRFMKLMAYADGELEGDELADVEKLIASDAEAARVVTQMGGLGDFVRLGHEDKVAPLVAKVNLTDAIMKAVDKAEIEPAKPAKTVSNVSSLDAARAKRRNVGMAVAAALALAASVFVMTRDKGEAPIAAKPVPTHTAPSPMANAPAVNASTSAGVEVEAVESPGHSVSVFYLPTANELSTSVTVWVDETSGEKK